MAQRKPPSKHQYLALPKNIGQSQPADPEMVKRQLYVELSKAVSNLVKECKWDKPRSRMGNMYAEALVYGNGKPPLQLSEEDRKSIELLFARQCVKMKVPDGQLPGQLRPEYKDRKREAQATSKRGKYYRR